MKYRKKPVVIEAVQWAPDRIGSSPRWYLDALQTGQIWFHGTTVDDDQHLIVRTLEGDMRANPGDYIIKGIQGELYPCKPNIFHATYEKVEA